MAPDKLYLMGREFSHAIPRTLEQAEDGWIVAECPALPGCISQGKDQEEALANIKEAIVAWLWAEDQKAMADLQRQQAQNNASLVMVAV